MASNKFYVTTAIDYVNAAPHIGHALEKIQADVLARLARTSNDEVYFLTGADEHGSKIFKAANEAKNKPQEFVDKNSTLFKELKSQLNLSWNDFIRTTDRERHWPAVAKLWKKLAEMGDLYQKKYKGLYCVGHEAFVTEKDLTDGKCADHQKEPELIEELNWFFKLSKYSDRIKKIIETDEIIIRPISRKNEMLSFINRGLEDVSFSRPSKDLPWGIPVPGDESQNIYVWADALTNYLSAIGYESSKFNFDKYWPANVHVIGKDILRFHAAIWPGMLLSAGLALPKAIYVHGFITIDGRKISKSVGNIIAPSTLVDKYGSDAVRYYLLREILKKVFAFFFINIFPLLLVVV